MINQDNSRAINSAPNSAIFIQDQRRKTKRREKERKKRREKKIEEKNSNFGFKVDFSCSLEDF